MFKNKRILALEIIGTIFIITVGTLLHFTYAWSGNNLLVGSFSAVNESLWEHLKLPFWPSLFWILLVLFPLRKTISNFFSAKLIGVLLMVVIIPIIFYSYTAFSEEILAVDIATFMVAVVAGQTVSYKLFKYDKPNRKTETIAVILIVVSAIFFIMLTYNPPHLPIFQDSNTGLYGP